MVSIINHLTGWLATPQGNLLYSTVLGVSIFYAFIAVGYAAGNQASAEKKYLQRVLLLLFLAQVILFLGICLAWLGGKSDHVYLPPLDRAIALFSLGLIGFIWIFPRPKVLEIGLMITLEAILMLIGIFSLLNWLRTGENAFFANSFFGAFAFYFGIVLLVVGLILIIIKRPALWGFGASMLVVLLLGYLAQFLMPQPTSDYTWLVRLGEMAGYPFLLALPRRLLPDQRRLSTQKIASFPGAAISPIDTRLIKATAELFANKSGQSYNIKLARLVAHLMEADICLLATAPKSGGSLVIPGGYNLRKEWEIEGFKVDGKHMPTLMNALLGGKCLLISGNIPDPETRALTDELDYKSPAHLMEVPFSSKAMGAKMGLVVLSRASQPEWNESDRSTLEEIASILSAYSIQPGTQADQTSELLEVKQALQEAQSESDQLLQAYTKLKTEFDRLSSQTPVPPPTTSEPVKEDESRKDLEDTVKFLAERNKELETLLSKGRPSSEEVDQLRKELRSALTDLARIPTTLSKSDQKMLEIQLSSMKRLDDMGQIELVSSISQEFRQPLSSILGYTDLLLSESVGIIGAMQRKFLERVKASTERLGMLMNELVQVLAIDGGKFDQTSAMVEVEWVIERAISSLNAQIKEKNITISLDIPEELPAVKANRDALEQIVTNLLQNACLITPVDGEIRLSARAEQRDEVPQYLIISVVDQGGGIEQEDIPRVFSRRYRMDNPLIQGIGDTGVGLSIVKSLAELQKGRVWVDTEEGIGSTFTVLLPLVVEAEGQASPSPASAE